MSSSKSWILNDLMDSAALLLIFIYLSSLLTFTSARSVYFLLDTNGPETYNFGYDIKSQDQSEPRLMREEKRLPDGTVVGRYGYSDPFGRFRQVTYTAGPLGYFAFENVNTIETLDLFSKATALQKAALFEFVKKSKLSPNHSSSSSSSSSSTHENSYLSSYYSKEDEHFSDNNLSSYKDENDEESLSTELPFTDAPVTSYPPSVSLSSNDVTVNPTTPRHTPFNPTLTRLVNLRTNDARRAYLRLPSLPSPLTSLNSVSLRPTSLKPASLRSALLKPMSLNSETLKPKSLSAKPLQPLVAISPLETLSTPLSTTLKTFDSLDNDYFTTTPVPLDSETDNSLPSDNQPSSHKVWDNSDLVYSRSTSSPLTVSSPLSTRLPSSFLSNFLQSSPLRSNSAVPSSTPKPKPLKPKSSRSRPFHIILQNAPPTTSTPVHVIPFHSTLPDLELKPLSSTSSPLLNTTILHSVSLPSTTLKPKNLKPPNAANSLPTLKPLKPISVNSDHLSSPDSNLELLPSTPFSPHSVHSNYAHFNIARLRQNIKPTNTVHFLPPAALSESVSAHLSSPNSNIEPLLANLSPSLFSAFLNSNSLRLKPLRTQSSLSHSLSLSNNSSSTSNTSTGLTSSNLVPLLSTPSPVVFSRNRDFVRISPSLSNLTFLHLLKPKPLEPVTLNYHRISTTTPAPITITVPTHSLPEISLKPLSLTSLPESTSTTVSDILSTTRLPSSSLPLISSTSALLSEGNVFNQNLNFSRNKVKSSSPNEIKKWQTSFAKDKNLNQSERVTSKDKDRLKGLRLESEYDLNINHNKSTIGAEVSDLRDFIRKGSQKVKLNEPQINRNINQASPNQVQNIVLKQSAKPKLSIHAVDQITSPLPKPEEVHALANKSQFNLNKKEDEYSSTLYSFDNFRNPQPTLHVHHNPTVGPRPVTVSLQRLNNNNNNNNNQNFDQKVNNVEKVIQNRAIHRESEFRKSRRHFGDRITAIQKENNDGQNDVPRPFNNEPQNELKFRPEHILSQPLGRSRQKPLIKQLNAIKLNQTSLIKDNNRLNALSFVNKTVIKDVPKSASSFNHDPKKQDIYLNGPHLTSHQAINRPQQGLRVHVKPESNTDSRLHNTKMVISDNNANNETKIRVSLVSGSFGSNSIEAKRTLNQEDHRFNSVNLNNNNNVLDQDEKLINSTRLFSSNFTIPIRLAENIAFNQSTAQIKAKICNRFGNKECVVKDELARVRKRTRFVNGTRKLRLVSNNNTEKANYLNLENNDVVIKKRIIKIYNKKPRPNTFGERTSKPITTSPSQSAVHSSTQQAASIGSSLPHLASAVPSSTGRLRFRQTFTTPSSLDSYTVLPLPDLIHSSNKLYRQPDYSLGHSNQIDSPGDKPKYIPPIGFFGFRRPKSDQNDTVAMNRSVHQNNSTSDGFYTPPIPVI